MHRARRFYIESFQKPDGVVNGPWVGDIWSWRISPANTDNVIIRPDRQWYGAPTGQLRWLQATAREPVLSLSWSRPGHNWTGLAVDRHVAPQTNQTTGSFDSLPSYSTVGAKASGQNQNVYRIMTKGQMHDCRDVPWCTLIDIQLSCHLICNLGRPGEHYCNGAKHVDIQSTS